MSLLEQSGIVRTDLPGGAAILRRYEWYAPAVQFSLNGSCGVPGPPYGGSNLAEAGGRVSSETVPLGREDPLSHVQLAVDRMVYTWGRFPRVEVTLTEVLAVKNPRPDIRRFQLMAASPSALSVEASWGAYMAQGPAFQVPAEVPCDRTFVFSPDEATYVDRASGFLFGAIDPSVKELPLPHVESLYSYPTPGWTNRCRPELIKATMNLMRLRPLALWTDDWAVHRRVGSDLLRVTAASSFAPGLKDGDFAVLPAAVADAFTVCGLDVLLPPVLKFFGFAAGDPRHPTAGLLQNVVAQEWAAAVLCGYSKALVFSRDVINYVRRAIGTLWQPLNIRPDRRPGRAWTFADALMKMEAASHINPTEGLVWNDYATRMSSEYVHYNTATEQFRRKVRKGGGRRGSRSGAKRSFEDIGNPSGYIGGFEPPALEPEAQTSGGLDYVLTSEDMATLSAASTALGGRVSEKWRVEALIETLAHWYQRRTTSLRGANASLQEARAEADDAERRNAILTSQVESLRATLRAVTDGRDRYLRQRDEYWYALERHRDGGNPTDREPRNSYGGRGAPIARQASLPDPYESYFASRRERADDVGEPSGRGGDGGNQGGRRAARDPYSPPPMED